MFTQKKKKMTEIAAAKNSKNHFTASLFFIPMNECCWQPTNNERNDAWDETKDSRVVAAGRISRLLQQLEAHGLSGGQIQQFSIPKKTMQDAPEILLDNTDMEELVNPIIREDNMESSDDEDDDVDSLMEGSGIMKFVSPQVTEVDTEVFFPKQGIDGERKSKIRKDLDEILASHSITDEKFKIYEQQIAALKITSLLDLKHLNHLLNDNQILSHRIRVIRHDLQMLSNEYSKHQHGFGTASGPTPDIPTSESLEPNDFPMVMLAMVVILIMVISNAFSI